MRSPWLWAIVGVALALRLTLLEAGRISPRAGFLAPDSDGYLWLAKEIVKDRAFGYPGSGSETFRTPGYPVFLIPAVLSRCHVSLVIQVLLDCVLVVLTYLLGRRMVSHQAGLLAAFFQAISPLAIASSCRILSDSLYAFMLTVVMLLLVRHYRQLQEDARSSRERHMETSDSFRFKVELSSRTWRSLLLAAVVLGAATYVRPVGQMMAAAIVLAILCGRRGLIRATAFVLVFAACLSPWIARNIRVADTYSFSTFAHHSFINYTCWRVFEDVNGLGGQPRDQVKAAQDEALREAVAKEFPGENEWDYDVQGRYLLKEAARHPGLAAKYHLQGGLIFWLPGATDVLEVAGLSHGGRGTLAVILDEGLPAGVRHYFGEKVGGGTLALTIAMVAVYLAQVAGLALFAVLGTRWALRNRLRIPPIVWMGLLLVLLSMLAPGPASHPRFRVPLEPMLNVAAAVGYLWMLRRNGIVRS